MEFNKKALSPVVATALLLVVVVVAVAAFSSWFTGYQSRLNSDVEERSNAENLITLQYLAADGTLYLKNEGAADVTVNSIKVGANPCSATPTTLTASVVTEVATNCTTNANTANNVVVSTSSGVFSGTLISG